MNTSRQPIFLLASVFVTLSLLRVGADSTRRSNDDLFESRIRPLLVERCTSCHCEKVQRGGLRLDIRVGWQKGGGRGPAIVPGHPERSLIIKAVGYSDSVLRMPPKKPLSSEEVAALTQWIQQGAIDPRDFASKPNDDNWDVSFKKRLNWWSLKPLRTAKPPEVTNSTWSRDPIDRFILNSLLRAGLAPALPAKPEVLLRRLSFVLTGLPPTPEMRERFLANWSNNTSSAYDRLVEDLLASPHFGERFARHWMDVVRYTDTYGYESDNQANGSWEYRDYLIRAFNKDVSYAQMVREQLAGDLLPNPRIDHQLGLNESMIGPMFYHLGENREGGSIRFNGVHQQMVDNRIDAFSKAFLGLTVACARCHDHKFEAVSQRDYYALAAMFMTPRWTARMIDEPHKNATAIKTLKRLRDSIQLGLMQNWVPAVSRPGSLSPEILRTKLDSKTVKAARIDDITYHVARILEAGNETAKVWEDLSSKWYKSRADRIKANLDFTKLGDMDKGKLPEGWVVEGEGVEDGFVEDATPLISLEGDTVISRLLPRGIHTNALSSKLPGAIRMPPEHLIPGRFISLQLAGGEYGGYNVVESNGFKSEEVGFFKSDKPDWKTFSDSELTHGVTEITVEFATTTLNPNFPPRIGLSHGLPPSDMGYEKRSWFSLTGIASHDKRVEPQDTLDCFVELYKGTLPKTPEEAISRLSSWFIDAVKTWWPGSSHPGAQPILEWLLTHDLLPNRADKGSTLESELAKYRQIEKMIPFSRTVTSMDERERVKQSYPLNVRGNVDVLGELIPPDSLQMFAGYNAVAKSRGSGRLELADSLVSSENPLTARVYVNRVWQWIFGTGLVSTPDDVGHLGDKPSHPELLDYLAREFMRDGWSTKKLIRRLVRSETFKQSGTINPSIAKRVESRDPNNRLLHHYPTRRLEAEAIRDSPLAVSGRLDPKLFGHPINPPRTLEDKANKRLFSGPLDGEGRRSIYTQLSIMDPPKFLVSFNLPDLKLPSGRRDVTNVPGQALVMLNDPFVGAMAKFWAERLVKIPHVNPEERLRVMFIRAFGRLPQKSELSRWVGAVKEFADPRVVDLMKDDAAWTQVAHALFNAKEFIYYR